jgi:hypothetical protein
MTDSWYRLAEYSACIGGEQHNGPHAWARGVPDVHERAGAGLRGRQPLRLREGSQGEMQHALVR